jgi:hypothetical protein
MAKGKSNPPPQTRSTTTTAAQKKTVTEGETSINVSQAALLLGAKMQLPFEQAVSDEAGMRNTILARHGGDEVATQLLF